MADPVNPTMLINARFLTRHATGVDRFAIELLQAGLQAGLLPQAQAVVPAEATLVTPAPKGLAVRHAGRHGGHRWEQFELPALAAAAGEVPLVNLCNTAPLRHRRQIAVIHDAAAVANPQNYSFAFRQWYRVMIGSLMRRSRVIATVSRFSADELTRHFGAHHHGIEVIPEGGEHILRLPADPTVFERLDLRGRRYVLAVGSLSLNKNFAAVLNAMSLIDDPDTVLVAAGGGNTRIFTDSAVQHERLQRTGYVSDQQLRALYEGAACFVFPSFYEGFGLPPLEAMCCGCPVIVSDRASLPEVCADAALYCNPDDPATLAAQLRRVLGSPALTDELRTRGYQRAAQLTWDRAAREFAELMDLHFA
ncbi:glycosyltransferase family 4 protein [Sphaerotilus montanus]|uniref:glycosyltransferase family 4 protein n=1 Tax=Sphaerotilus montanus TaxID=522889 RepID=UPI003FA29709